MKRKTFEDRISEAYEKGHLRSESPSKAELKAFREVAKATENRTMTERARITKAERKLLRTLAGEAWEAELHAALTNLFDNFAVWADKGMSSFELSDKIHEFHNGIARELYGRYSTLDPEITVGRAIALGLIEEDVLEGALLEKLAASIESFREMRDE